MKPCDIWRKNVKGKEHQERNPLSEPRICGDSGLGLLRPLNECPSPISWCVVPLRALRCITGHWSMGQQYWEPTKTWKLVTLGQQTKQIWDTWLQVWAEYWQECLTGNILTLIWGALAGQRLYSETWNKGYVC